ncbi:unnamed protein product [Pleuronectes platessa]|uniref:Uncharacterized protein n=1 Tax=Pleuronectes platessa TaxID=8262 RepID=A0A9N7YVE2_PLEPL|nr:unnamed protein product [Pleuronectes platessa]
MSWGGAAAEELRRQVRLTRPALPAPHIVSHRSSSAGKPLTSQHNNHTMLNAHRQPDVHGHEVLLSKKNPDSWPPPNGSAHLSVSVNGLSNQSRLYANQHLAGRSTCTTRTARSETVKTESLLVLNVLIIQFSKERQSLSSQSPVLHFTLTMPSPSLLPPPAWLLLPGSSTPAPPPRLLLPGSSCLPPPPRLLHPSSSCLAPPAWLLLSESSCLAPPAWLLHPSSSAPAPPAWLLRPGSSCPGSSCPSSSCLAPPAVPVLHLPAPHCHWVRSASRQALATGHGTPLQRSPLGEEGGGHSLISSLWFDSFSVINSVSSTEQQDTLPKPPQLVDVQDDTHAAVIITLHDRTTSPCDEHKSCISTDSSRRPCCVSAHHVLRADSFSSTPPSGLQGALWQ